MKIAEVSARPPQLVQQLVEVWQRSVQATHLFLSAPEIAAIRTYVPQALCGVEHLIVAQDESGTPVGFMGVQENRLEMLFLDPEARGQGLGARLLCLGMEQYGVSELTVNEQNPAAAGFYRHMGFAVYRRSELDEQGGPYPILYMRRGKALLGIALRSARQNSFYSYGVQACFVLYCIHIFINGKAESYHVSARR